MGPLTVSWDTSEPLKTKVDYTPDLEVGGGVSFCFDNPSSSDDNCEKEPLPYDINVGFGKWAGVSSNGDKICIKIGLSTGYLPIDFSLPIE